MIMAPIEYETPDSTGYDELRQQSDVWVIVPTYKPSKVEVLIRKEKPSWPQERKNKRKNYK